MIHVKSLKKLWPSSANSSDAKQGEANENKIHPLF